MVIQGDPEPRLTPTAARTRTVAARGPSTAATAASSSTWGPTAGISSFGTPSRATSTAWRSRASRG
jgi:hypothetical protein